MTEHTPHIDFENLPAPSEGFLVTLFLTVRSVARSRAFSPRSSAATSCWSQRVLSHTIPPSPARGRRSKPAASQRSPDPGARSRMIRA